MKQDLHNTNRRWIVKKQQRNNTAGYNPQISDDQKQTKPKNKKLFIKSGLGLRGHTTLTVNPFTHGIYWSLQKQQSLHGSTTSSQSQMRQWTHLLHKILASTFFHIHCNTNIQTQHRRPPDWRDIQSHATSSSLDCDTSQSLTEQSAPADAICLVAWFGLQATASTAPAHSINVYSRDHDYPESHLCVVQT